MYEYMKKMSEFLPKCPMCGFNVDVGYWFEIEGTFKRFAKCKLCDAKWLLGRDDMELKEPSKDGRGRALMAKKRPFSFWQNIEEGKLKVKTKIITGPQLPLIRRVCPSCGMNLSNMPDDILKCPYCGRDLAPIGGE